MQCFQAS